ncbi:MAG: hypothetical protein ACRDRN_03350 [Sciscionella sp.]
MHEPERHEEIPDELIGLDPDDPETKAFAEHLLRMRNTHANYTVEGYLANFGEFANSANRADGHRRLMAIILVSLLLLGVLYAVWEALSVIFSTFVG